MEPIDCVAHVAEGTTMPFDLWHGIPVESEQEPIFVYSNRSCQFVTKSSFLQLIAKAVSDLDSGIDKDEAIADLRCFLAVYGNGGQKPLGVINHKKDCV